MEAKKESTDMGTQLIHGAGTSRNLRVLHVSQNSKEYILHHGLPELFIAFQVTEMPYHHR